VPDRRTFQLQLVDDAMERGTGELVDPAGYPRYLGEALRARLLQLWYRQNADAGRSRSRGL
jgi:hypothetical protein